MNERFSFQNTAKALEGASAEILQKNSPDVRHDVAIFLAVATFAVTSHIELTQTSTRRASLQPLTDQDEITTFANSIRHDVLRLQAQRLLLTMGITEGLPHEITQKPAHLIEIDQARLIAPLIHKYASLSA